LKTKLKILHLEDTPADAELVERELKKGNIQFEKLVVANKIAFEKALNEFAPDIIIADHTLPSFDSKEAIKIIKQKGIKIPFILVSATVSDEYAVEIMKAGADDYILKDRLHRLPQAVVNAMEKFSMEQERERMIYDQAHLAAIVNASNDGIISKTLDGIITSWNTGAEKLLGYSEVETIGRNISIIIPPDCLPEEAEFMESIKRGESVQQFETVRLSKNGTRVDVSLTISPIKDNNGKVIGAAKIVYDITDRKKAGQIIYDSEEKYHSLFENSLDAILLTVTDGKILAANPAACTMFGMSEKEICEAGRFGLVDTADPRVAAAIEERQRTGTVKAELTLIRGNGERFPGELTSVVYKNAYGEQRTSMIVRDISERKHAEEEITKLSLVARKTSNAVVITDAKGKIQWVNDAFTQMTEFEIHEIIGKRPGTFLQGPETNPVVVRYMRRKISNRQAFQCDIINYSKSGKKYWTNIKCQPEFDSTGKLTGFFSIQTDITKDKEAEKAIYELTERMALATTSAKMGIWDWDVVNNQLVWDKIMYQIFGVAEDEFGGAYESWEAIIHPDDIAEENAKVQSALSGGSKFDSEFRILWPDKSIRYIKGDAILIRDDTGKPLRMIGTNLDITEKKRLEKAVETERDQFFEMFSKAPSAIGMLKGADHVFEMVNPLYLQLIGEKDVIGKTVAEVLPEVIEQGFVSMLDHVYQTGESYTGTEKLVKVDMEGNGDFTDFYIDFVYQAYRNGEGNIEGVFFFINDVTEQKVSKKKIEKSEKQYRQIVETAQEGIWLLDENSRTTFVNKKMCEILGYTEEELIGKEHSYYMDEDGKEKAVLALERRKKGIAENIEFGFISENGKHVITMVSANPIFDDLGNFKGSLGMVSDITEKLMADKLLLESEQKYRKLASELAIERTRLVTAQAVAKVGSWETDLQTLQVNWSNETHRIFGSNPDKFEASHSAFLGFIHPEDREKVDAAFEDSLHKSGFSSMEHRIITLQGIEKWVKENWSVTRDEKGSPMLAVGTCQDITVSKKAADKVIRSEAKLNVAQQIAEVGSYEVDMLTEEQSWSDEFYRILGINKELMPTREAFMLFVHPDDRAMALSSMENALSKYKDSSFQFRFIRKNGETGYASSEWKFEFDSHHNPMHIHGILRDLTKEKKAESERAKMISDIVQRNSDLEQFSYIVSHNLRAPVANILGLGDLIGNEDYTQEVKNDFLEALLDNVERLDIVVSDLNSILQVKGEIDAKKETVILNDLVDSIESSIQNLIEKEKVQIKTYFDVPTIHTVQSYLYSIFYNLIVNSIKYRKPGIPPQLDIRSQSKEGSLVITFEDNGLGIDLVKKGKQVFGLYKRFHQHIEGKGMGLFLVKTQVELLGGKISIESEVNAGTKFTITFKETTFNYITEDEKEITLYGG
jgi:PAS domain S-box-containing protein